MRMISGSVLILAGAVCAAGYQVAQAANQFAGGPLPFLAWLLILGGAAIMASAWLAELRAATSEPDKPADRKK